MKRPAKSPRASPKKIAQEPKDDKQTSSKHAQENREAAEEKLNVQIDKLKAHLKTLPKEQQQKPDPSMLKKFFDANQMSALWDRLKQHRSKATMSVKQAWESLSELKTGSQGEKMGSLIEFAVGLDWTSRLLQHTKSWKKEEQVRKTQTLHYREELRQQLEAYRSSSFEL